MALDTASNAGDARAESFPHRFRRRLTIAFVVVAGASAGALALGAALTVQSFRTATFEERARRHVQEDLRLLAAGAPASVVAARLADVEVPGGPGVIVVAEDGAVSSVETLSLADLPSRFRAEVAAAPDEIVEATIQTSDGSVMVLGTRDADTEVELFLFFPREELLSSLRELRMTLAVGWVAVVTVAGVAGSFMARRTLRPVRGAATAARQVAEGLLDTRLPVRSGDEFGEWATAFNEMVAALEEKIGALAEARDRERRMAVDVAHELRTPVAAVLTAASHIADQDGDLPAPLRGAAEIVAAAARRLDRLTAELLELHRLEARTDDVAFEPVDLRAAVSAAVDAHGWSDQVSICADSSIVVDTDRRRLDRILVNLLANALHHGGTRAVVSIDLADELARVAVSDNGPGIAATDLPHIFDRYYKAGGHRSAGKSDASGGTGLGLAIALESAQLLGGRLEAQRDAARGACFELLLPLRRSV